MDSMVTSRCVLSRLGDLETPYAFEQEVVGGAVPKNYFPAVEKGVQESVVNGPLAGYPVVGVKAILYDGSYHPVDSSEMAFKTAAIQAFKKGFHGSFAGTVRADRIFESHRVPDKYTGDVMGDLNKRRGRVLGMNPDHKGQPDRRSRRPDNWSFTDTAPTFVP